MITEDYVSFETAKLLREKGFNGLCTAYYDCFTTDNFHCGSEPTDFNSIDTKIRDIVAAPTLQMAMKWLRKVHDIYIMIDKDFATEDGWHYVVVRKQDWTDNIDNGLTQQESNNYTYEFACEAAIKYCLENLV